MCTPQGQQQPLGAPRGLSEDPGAQKGLVRGRPQHIDTACPHGAGPALQKALPPPVQPWPFHLPPVGALRAPRGVCVSAVLQQWFQNLIKPCKIPSVRLRCSRLIKKKRDQYTPLFSRTDVCLNITTGCIPDTGGEVQSPRRAPRHLSSTSSCLKPGAGTPHHFAMGYFHFGVSKVGISAPAAGGLIPPGQVVPQHAQPQREALHRSFTEPLRLEKDLQDLSQPSPFTSITLQTVSLSTTIKYHP